VRRTEETFPCPLCGADVPARSRSCPECGSDEETGWSEDTLYDGLDLPDPGYGREEPERLARTTGGSGKIVAIVLLILIGLFLLWQAV
jgi:hypothetical protein